MLFSFRVGTRALGELCRRLATSLESGIDLRRVFDREANSFLPGPLKRRLTVVRDGVAQGLSLADSVDATGDYFPKLFREMVRLGEQTGHQDEVFYHLAEHYEHQEQMRREFVSSITWPAIQFVMALGVITIVIWVSGFITGKDLRGKEIDLLGLGLKGERGAITFLNFIMLTGILLFILVQSVRRGVFWARPIQRLVMHVPKLGGALETLAVSRFAWSLHLTTDSGMGILKAIPLCMRAMQNARYTDHTEHITSSIRQGNTLTESLAETKVFPPRFLDAVDVGERSGRLPETMRLLSQQYQDEARRAVKVIVQIAAWAVTIAVACFIIFFIFRMMAFYLDTLKAALGT